MNLNPWQLWTKGGTPAEGTEEIVTVLESVLARNPEQPNPGDHLYLECAGPFADSSSSTSQRKPSGGSCAGCRTSGSCAGPASTFAQGDFETSARTNEAAAEADRATPREANRRERNVMAAMYTRSQPSFPCGILWQDGNVP